MEFLMVLYSIDLKMVLSISNTKIGNLKENGLMEILTKDNYFKVTSYWWILVKKRKFFTKKITWQLLLKKRINIFLKENTRMTNKMAKDTFTALFNNTNLVNMKTENKMEIVTKWLWIGEKYHKEIARMIIKWGFGRNCKIMDTILKHFQTKKLLW